MESETGRLLHREEPEQQEGSTNKPISTAAIGTAFEPGDVLFGRLRPYLAKTWVADFSGRCSTEFLVIRPSAIDADYLRYVFLSPEFVNTVDSSTFGSRMPRADWDFIGSIPIPLPDLHRQRNIVKYLDRQLAQLDALVQAKQRLLELLAEKRRGLTTHAVTHGIGPNAELRDSGIAWLGKVPAHWKVVRSRWLFRERNERSVRGDEELLTVSHLTGVTSRSKGDVSMLEAEAKRGYKICRPGDLAINTLSAWMGAMGVTHVQGIVSPDYNVYEPDSTLDPAFVDSLVRTPIFTEEVKRYSKGVWSSRLRLYSEGFFQVFLPIPPINEQRDIAAHIATESHKLEAVRVAAERSIGLLKERRRALISAAVYGFADHERTT
jgi:type I restriction enzyme S subunit